MFDKALAYSKLIMSQVPPAVRETAKLNLFALARIPMIFFCSPRVVELSHERAVVEIPLNARTKNHYRTMYFGALAVGADLGVGLLAQYLINETADGQVNLLFKDFQANFLKRPEGNVQFICEEGFKIRESIANALKSGERQNTAIRIFATVPEKDANEVVAEFVLTLSLKKKS